MQASYKVGQTQVEIYQANERGQFSMTHRGIIVGVRDNWLRVFNPAGAEKNGDIVPQNA